MCHDAHIGFVDAHSKGIRCHHDAHTVVLPVALALVLLRMFQSGMIEGGTESCIRQQFSHFASMAPTADIDNSRALLTIQQPNQFRPLIHSMADEVGEILTLERHAEDIERVES